MAYVPVYDFLSDDSVGLFFPSIGLALIAAAVVAKVIFGKSGMYIYPFAAMGAFLLLLTGAWPLWDEQRVRQAVRHGEAKIAEGPIQNWHLRYTTGTRTGTSNSRTTYYSEDFQLGGIAFKIKWNGLEAGFKNEGSRNGKPKIRLANGMRAKIWYVNIGAADKPPRIVRLELAPDGAAVPGGLPGSI